MAVSIIPVRSEQELTTFVDLPWTVYADQPLWGTDYFMNGW